MKIYSEQDDSNIEVGYIYPVGTCFSFAIAEHMAHSAKKENNEYRTGNFELSSLDSFNIRYSEIDIRSSIFLKCFAPDKKSLYRR